MKNKIAVCLINSTRNIKECLPTLYKHIVEPWNADVFGMFNTLQPKYIQEFEQVNKNKTFWESGAIWQDSGYKIQLCKQ